MAVYCARRRWAPVVLKSSARGAAPRTRRRAARSSRALRRPVVAPRDLPALPAVPQWERSRPRPEGEPRSVGQTRGPRGEQVDHLGGADRVAVHVAMGIGRQQRMVSARQAAQLAAPTTSGASGAPPVTAAKGSPARNAAARTSRESRPPVTGTMSGRPGQSASARRPATSSTAAAAGSQPPPSTVGLLETHRGPSCSTSKTDRRPGRRWPARTLPRRCRSGLPPSGRRARGPSSRVCDGSGRGRASRGRRGHRQTAIGWGVRRTGRTARSLRPVAHVTNHVGRVGNPRERCPAVRRCPQEFSPGSRKPSRSGHPHRAHGRPA